MAAGPASSHLQTQRALWLLIAINLVCYMDRYILAGITPALKAEFLAGDPDANAKAGLWNTAFLVSFMLAAPAFGWLADRRSRWVLIGLSVAGWSLACGASGLAAGFASLLLTRVFLGLGEAGYGPSAPTLIADLYPVEQRNRKLSLFFMAIPVGSAFGFAFGGLVQHALGWRWAFFLMVPVGLILALLCFREREPRERATGEVAPPATRADYLRLLRTPSYVCNVAAQTAMTFSIGGLSVWAPTYIHEAHGLPIAQVDLIFGALLAVAGLTATLAGGRLADYWKPRHPGAYFLVAGIGMMLAFPMTATMLFLPFPLAWVPTFLAMFFLFINIGPANTAMANVTSPAVRSTAFAINILVIHLLGDAISPWLIGVIRDRSTWEAAFLSVSCVMLVAGMIWLLSIPRLVKDLEAI
jgi:MFS family permease